MPFTKNFRMVSAAVIAKREKTFKNRQCCRFLNVAPKHLTEALTYTKSGNVAGFRLCVAERVCKSGVVGIQNPDARSAEV